MNIKQILQNEGYVFKHYESVNSTMDTIKELFNYNKNKLFILADKQVEGEEVVFGIAQRAMFIFLLV